MGWGGEKGAVGREEGLWGSGGRVLCPPQGSERGYGREAAGPGCVGRRPPSRSPPVARGAAHPLRGTAGRPSHQPPAAFLLAGSPLVRARLHQ